MRLKAKTMFYFVYDWVDSHDIPFYVGITNNPNARYAQHMRQNSKVKQLLSEGVTPKMRILEVVEGKEMARKQEIYWMQIYHNKGIQLINVQRNIVLRPERKGEKYAPKCWKERERTWKEWSKEARNGEKLYIGSIEVTTENLRAHFEFAWCAGCVLAGVPDCECIDDLPSFEYGGVGVR